VVRAELETLLARAAARERPAPRFVERELRAFLRCGVLAHGFVRVHCPSCGLDRVVPFSCKGRGVCPSCGGRRMADMAAHLIDRVLPRVPVRQWVLSLPFALRYRLAYDASLASAVLGSFVRTVFSSLRRRARRRGLEAVQCGAVTFVQRFGDALNLNVHFHSLVLDGVYTRSESGAPRFHPLAPPDDAEVARVVRQIARRLARLLESRGLGMRIPRTPIRSPVTSRCSRPCMPHPSPDGSRRAREQVAACSAWEISSMSRTSPSCRARAVRVLPD
jgi:hypothetical protein